MSGFGSLSMYGRGDNFANNYGYQATQTSPFNGMTGAGFQLLPTGTDNGLTFNNGQGGFNYGLNQGSMPATDSPGSWWNRAGGFLKENGETIGLGVNALGALVGGFNSFRNYGLAKDNFNLQKRAFETNLANSTRSYNTSLEDRIRGRSSEQSEADIQAYLSKHRMGG